MTNLLVQAINCDYPDRAIWWGLALAFVVWGATALAEEPQARPGVICGFDDKCHQVIETYGDFRDLGPEIPCDDRYKDGEKIAYDGVRMESQLEGGEFAQETKRTGKRGGPRPLPALRHTKPVSKRSSRNWINKRNWPPTRRGRFSNACASQTINGRSTTRNSCNTTARAQKQYFSETTGSLCKGTIRPRRKLPAASTTMLRLLTFTNAGRATALCAPMRQ